MPRIVADQILNHLRQAGVTPQLSTIYLLLRSRIFIFGGLVMNSTIPVDEVCLANGQKTTLSSPPQSLKADRCRSCVSRIFGEQS
jgi:hypothetical protein